jgi:hypothetical protein
VLSGSSRQMSTSTLTVSKNLKKHRVEKQTSISNRLQNLYFIVTRKTFFSFPHQKSFLAQSLHFA